MQLLAISSSQAVFPGKAESSRSRALPGALSHVGWSPSLTPFALRAAPGDLAQGAQQEQVEGPEETPSESEVAAVSWDRPCPGLSGADTGGARSISRRGALRATQAPFLVCLPAPSTPWLQGLQLTVRSGLCVSPGQREAGGCVVRNHSWAGLAWAAVYNSAEPAGS